MFGKNSDKNQQEQADYEYFTLYDSKVGIYKEPMLAINQHDMLRQIDTLMRDPKQQQNQLVTNSEDFQLFKVGAFWKKTGVICGCTPQHIANLHEIRSAVMRSIPLRNDSPEKIRDVSQQQLEGIVST